MVEKVVQVKEGLLFLRDAARPGEAKKSVIQSAFLFGPLEDVFGFLVEFLFGDLFVSVDQGLDDRRTVVLVADIVGCVLCEETDAL
jgi:hypothetical protein